MHFMLDHQSLLFLVIGSTVCLTLCQWYIITIIIISSKIQANRDIFLLRTADNVIMLSL